MSEEAALRLAEDIIATQGAAFVRELLRTLKQSGAKVMVGVRKADTLNHLTDAIRAGFLSFDDLIIWLNGVEGWGKQHVYPYSVSATLCAAPFWKDPVPDRLFAHVRGSGLALPNEQKHVIEFPENFRLGRIAYDGEVLDMVWRKGTMEWRRETEMDEEKTIGDDLYRFEAWRQTPERSVLRFALSPVSGRAALFVQIPLGEEHQNAVTAARGTLSRLFALSHLRLLNISDSIKLLDQAGQDGRGARLPDARGSIRPQATSFSTYGASVGFSARDLPSYASVEPVRRVRRALRLPDFTGDKAKFVIDLAGGPGLNRSVKMSLDGSDNRLYFFASMSAAEVWAVIDYIFSTAA